MCSRDKYALVSDFRWLVRVLVVLIELPGRGLTCAHAISLSDCLIDVALRVKAVRPAIVASMIRLLLSSGDKIICDGGGKTGGAAVGLLLGCFVFC